MSRMRIGILTLGLGLLSVAAIAQPAYSAPLDLSTALHKVASPVASRPLRAQRYGVGSMTTCDPGRRALIGAAIGFGTGMVIIRRVARDEGGHISAKDTFLGGAYGAAIGGFVGLRTCW